MKSAGGIFLWLSIVLSGVKASLRLKKRLKALEKTIMLLNRISIEISYLNSSIPSIISLLSKDESLSELDFLFHCSFLLENSFDFPTAWKQSIRESELPFNEEERNDLIQLSEVLGASDLQGQERIIGIYMDIFSQYCAQAGINVKKYSSLAVTCSVFIGCIIFIMLL